MTMSTMNAGRYELRFQPLAPGGECFAFPCDAEGHVDLDGLSDHDRGEYLYARAVIGLEVAMPAVRISAGH